MKILTAVQLRLADQYTIENEPVQSIDLMERAAERCLKWLEENLDLQNGITYFFCGMGNNGGDGLVVARLLHAKKKAVRVFILENDANCSNDFSINLERLQKTGIAAERLSSAKLTISFNGNDRIIDAIFGSGLNRPVTGWNKDLITLLNRQPALRIAIDMPSGLFAEDNSQNDLEAVFRADITLSFQLPKLAFLLNDAGVFCGEWTILDIGLSEDFIENQNTSFFLSSIETTHPLLSYRNRFSHKGTYGHALILSGSLGKMGAAVLSAAACLRSGAGLLTVFTPACGYNILQTSLPEAMVKISKGKEKITDLPDDLSRYNVIGAGPGLGTDKETVEALSGLIKKFKGKLVLDADALNILSLYPDLLTQLPEATILTPHAGEFERMVGKSKNDYEQLEMLRNFSMRYKVITVLKGCHTAICNTRGDVWFNNSGNPGMATGGSGDVLTGIITGLMARGYTPESAARIGVYVHGLAGDLCAFEFGEEGMIAGDLVELLPTAILELQSCLP